MFYSHDVSAILSALRFLIASMLGIVLVLYDGKLRALTCLCKACYKLSQTALMKWPIRRFASHPPEAWSAP